MSDPAFLARVTRARVTAASSAMASDAFAGLSEARQSPCFGRRQAAAAPRGAPHGTGAGRPYPMDPTPGQARLDDLSQNTPACARKICAKQRRG
ncbi:hypothetical protein [Anaerotruncus colihominis]|uniref:hypothetical protein n=3 Tax=Anaerotruncus colihominis TaxID=169435 RepID=UPI000B01452A|nr:hypothetical protein [Anaerotruncus colihominis]MCQ4734616.1 hypothetical protein [Anaerotruncus colihominis]